MGVEHPGGIVALEGLNLRIFAGERLAVIGPSGAGKSTLLALCNATVVPTAGTVSFAGRAVEDTDIWRRTHGRSIAHIPQQLLLVLRLRVVHNVNSGKLAEWSTWRAARSLLRPVEVDAVTDILRRVGLADKLNVRTDRLSGGELQRVAVARALRQAPRLLLADEPTASLDPATSSDVMTLLTRLAHEDGVTLIVSQHDVDLALATCSRIVGLRAGRVVFDRPATDVTDALLDRLYART